MLNNTTKLFSRLDAYAGVELSLSCLNLIFLLWLIALIFGQGLEKQWPICIPVYLWFVSIILPLSVDTEQLWVWEYETEDGHHDLFMDINEEIRFRIIDEEFVDLTPEGPAPPPVADGEPAPPPIENKRSPYTISVS